jgi:hypothetical protein
MSNKVPFVFKAMFVLVDVLSLAVIVMSVYSYVMQITEQSGYAMDPIATTVSVFAGCFGLIANHINRQEARAMHK